MAIIKKVYPAESVKDLMLGIFDGQTSLEGFDSLLVTIVGEDEYNMKVVDLESKRKIEFLISENRVRILSSTDNTIRSEAVDSLEKRLPDEVIVEILYI
jgi:hypothetical protein